MLRFLRARTFEDPVLGRFKQVRAMWYPERPGAGLSVTMEGESERPSPEVVEVARRLLKEPEAPIQAARDFLQVNTMAQQFIKRHGELKCDGFTVNQSGAFAVNFSLSAWPDAMISVPFKNGMPCDAFLSD
jgi:hypothetical protein